jgi:hypothetical protein
MKEGLILYGPPSLLSGLSDEQGRREAMARTMICLHKGVRVPDVPYLRKDERTGGERTLFDHEPVLPVLSCQWWETSHASQFTYAHRVWRSLVWH